MSTPCCICGRTTCLHQTDYSRLRPPFGGGEPSPRPASLVFYAKPFFYAEPPQFVPSIPYIPVPPMLIGDEHGEPLYTLRPDGNIWHDGDEYASGDPW